MNRLIRFYNKNRKIIWMYILIIVAGITLLQILNSYAKVVNENNNKRQVSSVTTKKDSIKQNYSITNNETIDKNANDVLVEKIDSFIKYCNNGFIEQAYNLLSDDCKSELYKTKEEFKEKYYKNIFNQKRIYEAQLWITDGKRYTYRITLVEDMITTGKVNYLAIEDYYTLVYENGMYKLNINKFVGTEKITKEAVGKGVTIALQERKVYIDYEEYVFNIKNKTDNIIMLESREHSDNVYVEDKNEVQYIAHMYELTDEEIKVNPKTEKNVTIRFERIYKPSIKDKKIVFKDIVLDYKNYIKNKNSQRLELYVEI